MLLKQLAKTGKKSGQLTLKSLTKLYKEPTANVLNLQWYFSDLSNDHQFP